MCERDLERKMSIDPRQAELKEINREGGGETTTTLMLPLALDYIYYTDFFAVT